MFLSMAHNEGTHPVALEENCEITPIYPPIPLIGIEHYNTRDRQAEVWFFHSSR